MKYAAMVAVLSAAVSLTGCSDLVSLNPVALEADAKLDPALAGVWQGGDDMFVIRQDGSGYRIVYVGKDSSKALHGVLFQVGDAKLLDVVADNEDPFQVPVHMVVRVWLEPAKLSWAYLDADWMKQQAGQALGVQPASKRTLITAPGAAVRAFVGKYAADDRAHQEPSVLQRVQ